MYQKTDFERGLLKQAVLDKIIVLDDGVIVDSGDHESLLSTSSIYKEMYILQTKEANA